MDQKQAELAYNIAYRLEGHLRYACKEMERLRRYEWIREDEKWELITRQLEDQLWLLEERFGSKVAQPLCRLADL